MRKPGRSQRQSIVQRRAQHTQRRSRRLRQRATSFHGPLPAVRVRADDTSLTGYAGLLPVILFLTQQLNLPQRLRAIVSAGQRARLHPVHLVWLAFVVASLGGLSRLAHLQTLAADPLLRKFLRLSSWPSRKVFARALRCVSDRQRDLLEALVSELGFATLPEGTEAVVLDTDPTALTDYGEGEGSKFGYCGKGRRRRRHFPLVASVAATRAVVLVQYRDGSNVTAEELIAFFDELIPRTRARLGEHCRICIRGDAGIYGARVAHFLRSQGVSFTMALSLSKKVQQQLRTAPFRSVDDLEPQFASIDGASLGLEGQTVTLVRRRVHDRKAPPLGKKVEGLEHYRYQAIVSSEEREGWDSWVFYNRRADCERVFRVGKQVLALEHLVSRSLRANEVAFLLRALAFNVDLHFQAHCERRAQQSKREVVRGGLQWRQPRFYQSPGRLVRCQGHFVLHVADDEVTVRLWRFYAPDLAADLAAVEVTDA